MDPINYSALRAVDYFRKSTEAEDRQALSLQSQREETKRTKDYYRLPVPVAAFEESKSAKLAGNRPMFSEMMHMIRTGKADAIVCWNLTRLARNMTEGGEIIDLLSAGKLKAIITPTEVFNQNTDVSVMSLYFGASKQYVKTLSRDVKRGQRKKADMGIPHGVAAVGFTNDKTEEKGKRKWLVDSVRLPIVKKLLHMFLTGKYSAPELCEIAKNDLKLTTPEHKKTGGLPVARSYMYTLLRNPIYAGFFSLEGKEYELDRTLPRLITRQEHRKIQDLLGMKGRPRLTKREATYNHFATCGNCSGTLSPDFKFQVICSGCKKKFSHLNRSDCPSCGLSIEKMKNPTYLTYVFYYCINDKKGRAECPGNGIEEKNLEQQLVGDIGQNLAISKELSAWCIANIGVLKDGAIEAAINVQRNLESEKATIENKLKRLTILRISKDHSKEEVDELDAVQKQLREELSLIDLRLSDTNVGWFDEAKKDFDLMAEVLNIIQNGTPEQKKDVLHALRSNLKIAGKKVSITNSPAIEAFKTYLHHAREENKAFEPTKCEADKDKTEVFASVRPILLRGQDSNLEPTP
jgi:site-specific DNA recombinase